MAGERKGGVLGLFEEEEHDDGEGSHEDCAEPEGPAPAHGDGDVAAYDGTEIVLHLCQSGVKGWDRLEGTDSDHDHDEIDAVHGASLVDNEEIGYLWA